MISKMSVNLFYLAITQDLKGLISPIGLEIITGWIEHAGTFELQ